MRLLEIGEGFAASAGAVELTLTLRPDDEVNIELRGRIGEWQVERTLRADDRVEHSHGSVWRHLVSNSLGVSSWTLDEWLQSFGPGTVGRAFSELQDPARRSFEDRLTLGEVDLGDAGAFDGTALTVHVVPESPEDAEAWAAWLVWDGLREPVSRHELEAHLAAVRARFQKHDVALPDPDALLQEAHERIHEDPRAWRLIAPADLGLWEVPHG